MKVKSATTLVTGKPAKEGEKPVTEQHPPGTIVDLPDDEAKDLLERGIAVLPNADYPPTLNKDGEPVEKPVEETPPAPAVPRDTGRETSQGRR